jgi:LysM domain
MQFYQTKEGDTCGKISVQFSITLADFYFLDPHLNSTCSNLWLKAAYGVQAMGFITTYLGYPTSTPRKLTRPHTLTSETFTTEIWSALAPNAPSAPTETDKPLAPGSWRSCTRYRKVVEKPQFVDQSAEEVNRGFCWATLYCYNNTAAAFGISMEKLLTWNPCLMSSSSNANYTLLPNFRYRTLVGEGEYNRFCKYEYPFGNLG